MSACVLGCRTRNNYGIPAPEGYLCCDRCVTRLRDTLTEIVDRWHRIIPTVALLPATVPAARHTQGFESSPPGSVHLMALRDVRTRGSAPGDLRSPLEVLHGWACMVRDWRGVTRPDTATVDTEARTLTWHLDWLVREADPGALVALAGELAVVRAQLRTVTDEPAPPIVGHCTGILESDVVCGAPLRLPAGGLSLRCGGCGARYDGPAMVRLYVSGEADT